MRGWGSGQARGVAKTISKGGGGEEYIASEKSYLTDWWNLLSR